jgi:hypothetical protein
MAIDFMIMPLSRYISGDFVTPTMAFAWELGGPYSLFGPAGRRDIPKNTPFGGTDAPTKRAKFVPMVLDDLKSLPGTLSANLWDEASSAEPTFHRVDPSSYDSLLEEAKTRATRPSFLGLVKRKTLGPAHIAAMVFFPVPFDEAFEMPVVLLERLAGSAPVALRELEAGGWADAASSARDTLMDALRDAVRLNLPMIVDV